MNLEDPANRQGVDTTCIICLEEMQLAQKLRCGQGFHMSCLRRWIESNVKCPICRVTIDLGEVSASLPAQTANNN